jgi:hypothetical protein
MNSDHDTRSKVAPRGWVSPFGDPGINDRSHLPRAFRSVPRPSSPLSAKASTRCPSFALDPRAPSDRDHPAARRPGKPPRTGASPKPSQAPQRNQLYRGQPRRGLSHEDTSPDSPKAPAHARARSRPPRSHSQIRFTLQSTPPRDPVRPRRRVTPSGITGRPRNKQRLLRTSPPPTSKRSDHRDRSCVPISDLRWWSCPVVEVNGIEPMTSCLQSRRSPN